MRSKVEDSELENILSELVCIDNGDISKCMIELTDYILDKM